MWIEKIVGSVLWVLIALVSPAALAGQAEDSAIEQPLSLDALAQAFGWDLYGAEISSEKVADGLYVLFGIGGNIGVSIGADGVLIVDNQFPQVMDKIEAALADIGGNGVDYAINTHWHFDHAEGNLALGPRGTTLVAHSNARADMAKGGLVNLVIAKYQQQPYPKAALPVLTLDELSEHDGRDRPTVYVSVKGRVYDVTTSTSICPGGNYHFLCGRYFLSIFGFFLFVACKCQSGNACHGDTPVFHDNYFAVKIALFAQGVCYQKQKTAPLRERFCMICRNY